MRRIVIWSDFSNSVPSFKQDLLSMHKAEQLDSCQMPRTWRKYQIFPGMPRIQAQGASCHNKLPHRFLSGWDRRYRSCCSVSCLAMIRLGSAIQGRPLIPSVLFADHKSHISRASIREKSSNHEAWSWPDWKIPRSFSTGVAGAAYLLDFHFIGLVILQA